ncbi:SDR family NAD(P)-dependent oxidoreductase, partial [Lactobacillus nasalidis]
MSDSLRNKVVVITGASSGIGRSIAMESASRGATVVLLARRLDKLEEIA